MSERRQILSWAFYDWANSAFATTVLAGFFPLFFKQYWSAGQEATTSTFHLGIANSASSLVILLLAPTLGAIADRGGARKRLLACFMILGVLATAGLYLVGKGMWFEAALLFVLGAIGFSGSIVFYDSLLVDVARPRDYDRVSALGYGLGYLGGGLLFAVNVLMTLKPQWFGLADAAAAVRLSFLTVAVWWLLFSLPLFVNVREQVTDRPAGWLEAVRGGFRQLADTFAEIRKLRTVLLFLCAYWLYIDGVDTIIRMAVDYGMALGFEPTSLIVALLIVQFVGFPAAIAFGWLGGAIGTKRALLLGIAVYMGVTVWGYFLENERQFYLMAITIGLVQGGVQSLSRSYYARLIPPGKSGEFFGFYNMLGKFAAIIGPLLVGWTAVLTGSSRLSILAVLLLFVSGAWLLWKVPEPERIEQR
ncbi:MAG TPA: MFS transporter [Nevskiales bacterium]|nr:MFS transporter [Nevskiales bacterium]